jgi:hypothetical protein
MHLMSARLAQNSRRPLESCWDLFGYLWRLAVDAVEKVADEVGEPFHLSF